MSWIETLSGTIDGVSSFDYRINYSKTKTCNPYLVIQDSPYNPGDFPIAAMEYTGFSPNKIVSVISRCESEFENTKDFEIVETLFSSGETYPIYHYPYSPSNNIKLKYLVTEFNSDIQNGKPLFYQYEPKFNVASTISGIINVSIYKNNEVKLKPEEFKIQYSYDYLSISNQRYSATTWGPIQPQKQHRIRVLLPYEFHNKDDFYTIEYNKTVNNIINYQKELIEIAPIYDATDYRITSSGLVILPSGRIQNTGTPLKIIKDPYTRIEPLDLITIKDQNSYMSDRVAQWKLRLQLGSFLVATGFYTGHTERMYNLEDFYSSGNYIALTNVKPKLVDTNIIKLKECPIYINESGYKYPNYEVEVYDKTIASLTDQAGKFAVDINGVTRLDLKIKSIDKVKGFVELNNDIDPTDEIETCFYLDNDGWLLLENLELNYKVNDSVSAYHASGYPNGFGIALVPWDNLSGSLYPYIFDTSLSESTRRAYSLTPVPEVDLSGVAWNGHEFFTICEININRLTPEMVKLTDARRPAGGIDRFSQLSDWLETKFGRFSHEQDWYTDHGYYDGFPISHGGSIIIHIPSDLLTSEKQLWIDHYSTSMGSDESEIKGTEEFNFYLDQVIRKYISAGTSYILIPTISGVFQDKIVELR